MTDSDREIIEIIARANYEYRVNTGPIHSNRMPAWWELSDSNKAAEMMKWDHVIAALTAAGVSLLQWRTDLENAPRDGTDILAYGTPFDEHSRAYAKCVHIVRWGSGPDFDDDKKTWRPQSPANYSEPTHFAIIPLPEVE